MNTTIIFQIQSFLILSLIFYGVYLRRNRQKHVKIMASAITWDILLVLQIQLNRSAIQKAVKVVENPMILTVHVCIALSTVLLYFALIYTGRKLLSGQSDIRSKHKLLGVSAVVLRTLTFITSFFAV
ncbi:MAG: hypothetical protein CME70_01760 [Halobacteriovorax sp.]|nr:hypothetical protein [Halobacteriovorax sp.]|tara:strand:- start:13107 stop:13487 length:381 start_codon:yes stop_codon:yes gene_type:complete